MFVITIVYANDVKRCGDVLKVSQKQGILYGSSKKQNEELLEIFRIINYSRNNCIIRNIQ